MNAEKIRNSAEQFFEGHKVSLAEFKINLSNSVGNGKSGSPRTLQGLSQHDSGGRQLLRCPIFL
ncbi:hypothetical protein [Spongiibacter marinus]|uniref:hypothetical protein n=1 Tax=Spongiibacter marinus TaxID=354246 RepID=UPI0003FE975C|nr:hypothetical protein [Spongiibacter marinus]